MYENPSKAYENIVAAVKASNGWITQRGRHYYGVLRGRYTGTYEMDSRHFAYKDEFDSGLRVTLMMAPLWAHWWDTKMHPVIGDLLTRVVDAAVQVFGADVVEHCRKWLVEAVTSAMTDAQMAKMAHEYEGDDYLDGGPVRWESVPTRVQAYLRKHDGPQWDQKYSEDRAPIRHVPALRDPLFQAASKLHIMSEVAGVPHEKIIRDLKEEPRRIRALLLAREFPGRTRGTRPLMLPLESALELPSHIEDRIRFSKVFLRTWSTSEAKKALSDGIQGGVTQHLTPQLARSVRPLVRGVGRWIADADKQAKEEAEASNRRTRVLAAALRDMAGEPEEAPHTPKPASASPAPGRVAALTAIANTYKNLNGYLQRLRGNRRIVVPSERFRDYLARKGAAWLQRVEDVAQMLELHAPELGEDERGRVALQHALDADLDRMYQDHNFVVEFTNRLPPQNRKRGDPAQLEKAHSEETSKLTLIPGVQPLVTQEQYTKEGTEMDHCVAGYFYAPKPPIFAFAAEDGTRATLELARSMNTWVVRQFFGPHNKTPSPACKKLLQEFLDANAKPKSNPLVGWKSNEVRPSNVHSIYHILLGPRAEEYYENAFRNVPFDVHVVLLLPGQMEAREKEVRAAVAANQIVLAVHLDMHADFDAGKKYERDRFARFTPFVLLHRLFDEVYNTTLFEEKRALAKRFTDMGSNVFWGRYSGWGSPAEHDVSEDDLNVWFPGHPHNSDKAWMRCASLGVDTAAGRNGACLNGEQALADLFAKYCLTGKVAFDPYLLPPGVSREEFERGNSANIKRLREWVRVRVAGAAAMKEMFDELIAFLQKGRVIHV